MTRQELRNASTELVNGLTKEQLLEFGVTRVPDLTGLDRIGIPVFTAVRPLSKTVSIHAGKGLERPSSRAGAILEAIEVHLAENPASPFRVAAAFQLPEEERLALEDCFPARASVVSDMTLLAWEEATNVQNGEEKLVPSDLIWMVPRIKDQPLMHLQMGSNGLAAGASVEDAILAGLYEVLERDSWTINKFLLDHCGLLPNRMPLIALPPALESAVRKIEEAECKVHLFDVTTDYKVPVFGAMVLDHSGNCAGTFAGYGCHLNAEIAAIRALTEAVQSRACYIAGARDDLFRRQFLLMKRLDQSRLDQIFSDLPAGSPLQEYRKLEFPDVRAELRYLLKLIRQYGVSEVYVKELGSALDGQIQVVRVISPQCEPHIFDHWQPGLRCLSYAERKMKSMSEQAKEDEQWK
jgi:ribosomal protein S12 methylthiotransferase accessory factor